MGEVYRAYDTKLKREVAVKVLPELFSQDMEYKARFEREAELLASLNHSNLAAIHTIDEHEGRPFIVMELLSGPTLRNTIDGPLPISRVLELALQISDGLNAAHAQNVVHRDIKPENIAITADGQAKILDFGLAKLVPAADLATLAAASPIYTEPGAAIGTVAYMSPEQARGEPTDQRTDLFSFGVVLFEMTTGRRPFLGDTPAAIFDAILNRAPVPIQGLNSAAPPELQRIIRKLLEKDCQLRYQSTADLRSDLVRLKREMDSGSMPALSQMADKTSIVVVPFTDVSQGKDKEYFADGLADEIITDLSQLQAIRVISRNSSMKLKDTSWDLKKIARELQVHYLLEGTVRSSGDNLRVTVQLVDATSGQNVWADKYSGKLEDIFDIQERISRQIVEALKMKLTPHEERRLADRKIVDLRAYECYQRARQDIYTFGEEGLDRALRLIEDGLSIVGENELLYAAQGTVYWQYVNAGIKPGDSYLDLAEACAMKAFRLNPESAPGFLVLGLVQLARAHHADALKSLRRALSIEPNNVYALGELYRVCFVSGREREARDAARKSFALDPLSHMTKYSVFSQEVFYGNPEDSQALADGVLEAAPYYAILRFIYAVWLVHSGRHEEAKMLLARAPEESPQAIASACCRSLLYALNGYRDQAVACFNEELKRAARRVEWWAFYLSWCYAFLDETDQSLDWLEIALERGFIPYPFLSRPDVIFAKFHDHARFNALLERIKHAWENFPD
jgi:serine/threonine protein kinase